MILLALVPASGIVLQLLIFRWSFIRGNRRVALRVMHVMTFASLVLSLLYLSLD